MGLRVAGAGTLRPTPPLVTLSASYGAGGSQVGPALAERLGVDFLDRAIPARVAERLAVSVDAALAHDESLGDAIGRFASSFAMLPELAGALAQAGVPDGEDYRHHTEEIIREHAVHGAVVLGRAGALVLREHPGALHVRLDGPLRRRVELAMRRQGIERAEAERLRRDADRARRGVRAALLRRRRARSRALSRRDRLDPAAGRVRGRPGRRRRQALNSGRITPRASVWNAEVEADEGGRDVLGDVELLESSACTANT